MITAQPQNDRRTMGFDFMPLVGHDDAEGLYRLYTLELLVVLGTSLSLHYGVRGRVKREIGPFWRRGGSVSIRSSCRLQYVLYARSIILSLSFDLLCSRWACCCGGIVQIV